MLPRAICLHFTNAFAKAFFGKHYDPDRLITVGWEENCRIRLNAGCHTMEAVRTQLPEGWEPELVWVWSPEFHANPAGLFEERVPLVALISDWNLGYGTVCGTLPEYDAIFTDKRGAELLRRRGLRQAAYAPLYSYDPAIHFPVSSAVKDIDVSIVGNLNHEVQEERSLWLKKLCTLRRKGVRVRIDTNLFGADYNDVMNRSKIVFNRSIRSEMNLRAYEAPAAGALMMLEDGNGEVEEHLVPFEEYVPYHENNYEQLILHYLSDPAGREAIAAAGHTKIVETDSYTHHMDRIWGLLQSKGILEAGRSPRSDAAREERAFAHLTQVYYASQGRSSQLMELLLNRAGGAEARRKNAQACVRLLLLGEPSLGTEHKTALLQLSVRDWEQAAEAEPESALPLFNLLSAMSASGNHRVVLDRFDRFLSRSAQAGIGAWDGLLFAIPYDDFRVERERILGGTEQLEWRAAAQLNALFLSEAYEYKGKAHLNFNEWESAYASFKRSVEFRSNNIESRYLLASAAAQLTRWEEARTHLELLLRFAPFHWQGVMRLCELYRATGKEERAKGLALEYMDVIEAMSVYEVWRERLSDYV
ncbi:glycosyltransferase family protein [Paenibacillus silviterrae]|uniref:glycosyltransferase family protein n=1 Tax=Paenibacillus silviterrae TaxID=3242194 RepID=UPI002542D988|nr:glycosyltransferase [Paenibacillus chinjuensis]